MSAYPIPKIKLDKTIDEWWKQIDDWLEKSCPVVRAHSLTKIVMPHRNDIFIADSDDVRLVTSIEYDGPSIAIQIVYEEDVQFNESVVQFPLASISLDTQSLKSAMTIARLIQPLINGENLTREQEDKLMMAMFSA